MDQLEFYQRGNWAVSTPVWIFPDQTDEERIAMMVCAHPHWDVGKKEITENPSDQAKYLTVTEQCSTCGALRVRLLPEGIPEEPFDNSIPQTGAWYERLYNFGNFTILVRRYYNGPKDPPNYMVRVETAAGTVETSTLRLKTLLFSPAALDMVNTVERVVQVGPKRYADFITLKQGILRKKAKDQIRAYADSLFRIAQDVGPESIAAAKSILEPEIKHEAIEMEEYEIQALEREVQHRKASQKHRSK